jgi:DNA-binding CsgD family transcriptional regulator
MNDSEAALDLADPLRQPGGAEGTLSRWPLLAGVFNTLVAGLLLLDGFSLVMEMNTAASRILENEDGLSLRESRLRANRDRDDQLLQRLVAEAVVTTTPSDQQTPLAIPRRSGLHPYLVHAQPLMGGAAPDTIDRPRAAVWITDSGQSAPLSAQTLKRLWGLTPREAQAANLIAAGYDRAGLVEAMGISENAVRFHLKNLYRKTHTNSHAALLGLLLKTSAGLHLA